jgi:hypothetical protein
MNQRRKWVRNLNLKIQILVVCRDKHDVEGQEFVKLQARSAPGGRRAARVVRWLLLLLLLLLE